MALAHTSFTFLAVWRGGQGGFKTGFLFIGLAVLELRDLPVWLLEYVWPREWHY